MLTAVRVDIASINDRVPYNLRPSNSTYDRMINDDELYCINLTHVDVESRYEFGSLGMVVGNKLNDELRFVIVVDVFVCGWSTTFHFHARYSALYIYRVYNEKLYKDVKMIDIYPCVATYPIQDVNFLNSFGTWSKTLDPSSVMKTSTS